MTASGQDRAVVAVVFGGGAGRRMSTAAMPKQFLELNGKPIIVHTLLHFEEHPEVDAIAIPCLAEWIPHLQAEVDRFRITKVRWIVPGGRTGQLSIHAGLQATVSGFDPSSTTVIVHDAVRPLISRSLIDSCLRAFDEFGSAVSCSPATETVVVVDDSSTVGEVVPRSEIKLARAPQVFALDQLLAAHDVALGRGEEDMVDSCTMMRAVGHKVHVVDSPPENIKVTTASDFYILKGFLDAIESRQVFG